MTRARSVSTAARGTDPAASRGVAAESRGAAAVRDVAIASRGVATAWGASAVRRSRRIATTVITLLFVLAARPATQEAVLYERLCGQVAAAYDSARGGFVTRGGAPIESEIELAFALGREQGEPLWTARAHRTLDWMHALYDSTGGGYFLSLRDTDPMVSLFEKPTWANARRLENLIDAWRQGGGEAERRTAARVADYMDRVLADGRGGFVAGQMGDRDLVPEANGYAIRAWLRWAAVNSDPRVRDFALKSLDRVWESCWSQGFGLIRRDAFGESPSAPLLVDQAQMGRAFVLGAHIGGREKDLDRARTLGELLLKHFEDTEKGGFGWNATPRGEGKVSRGGRQFDQNAHAAHFMAELASITGDNRYRDAARRAARAFEKNLGRAGVNAAEWALALRALKASDLPPRPKWKEAPKAKAKPEAPKVFRPGGGGR